MSDTAHPPADQADDAPAFPLTFGDDGHKMSTVSKFYSKETGRPLPDNMSQYADGPVIFDGAEATYREIAQFRDILDRLGDAAKMDGISPDAVILVLELEFESQGNSHPSEIFFRPGDRFVRDALWPRYIACDSSHPTIKALIDKLIDYVLEGEESDEVSDLGSDFEHEEVDEMVIYLWANDLSTFDRAAFLLNHGCNPIEALRTTPPCQCEELVDSLRTSIWES